MNGIVIAAGPGTRMRPYTHERPKCMLLINDRPLISYILDGLRGVGCVDITIVTGHLAEQIDAPSCRKVRNSDYENNNILHSLMYARDFLEGDILVTYSDILVDPDVYKRLASSPGDMVIAVDRDWQPYYDGRTDHPLSEAEKAFVDLGDGELGRVEVLGKHLDPSDAGSYLCGEFLGLWKMTAAGARRFRAHFEALDARLSPFTPFRAAKEWRKAYITDFLTDMIACGTRVNCLLIERGWAELDTAQDYERFPRIVHRQRLLNLRCSP